MGKWLEALRAIDKHDGNEPAKPAKVPFDPFAGSILERFAREKTPSDAEAVKNDAANTPTNEPAKAPFDPFAGSILECFPREKTPSHAEVHEIDATHTSTKQPAKPAKGPADAEIHSDRHPATKNTATGNVVAKPCGPATTPEPEPPWLACGCCGARKWWWDGRGAWYCNQCMADVDGNGGHAITGKEVMRLVVR